MSSPLFPGLLLVGGLVADRLGPTPWRLYWIAIGLFVARGGWVVWNRLRLGRMAAGLILAACIFLSFGLIGGSQRESTAVVASNWLWFVSALIAIGTLFVWEYRHSPERLALYQKHLRAARWRDLITWQHVPHREGAREV
jgi:hypothetical protein